jgi:amino acid adenylation domain-containing protein
MSQAYNSAIDTLDPELLSQLRQLLAAQHGVAPDQISADQISDYLELLAAEADTMPAGLHTLFEEYAAQEPDAVAVVGDEILTYAALNQRADQVAYDLRQRGVEPNVLVALCLERSAALIVGMLGILKAGGACLLLDPSSPQAYLERLLAQAQPRLVLTQEPFRSLFVGQTVQIIPLNTSEAAEQIGALSDNEVTGEELAYVLFTGDQAIAVKQSTVHSRLQTLQDQFELVPEDVVLYNAPLALDTAIALALWPLSYGARIVLATPGNTADAGSLLDLIERQGVRVAHFTPTALGGLLAARQHQPLRSSLRLVLCSGEPMQSSLVDAFFQQANCSLYHLYATPETVIAVAAYATQPNEAAPVVPIGHALADPLYVLDAYAQPVPVGVVGELYVAGDQYASGYPSDSAGLARRVIDDPFTGTGDGRLLHTGDLARYRSDGAIELVAGGRYAWINGYHIDLGTVETVIRSDRLVDDCVVLARTTADGGAALVAYVVPAGQFSPDRLARFVQDQLPQALCPAAYVALAALPLTKNGKLDTQQLQRLEVLDQVAIDHWQARLSTDPAVDQAIVVIEEALAARTRLHLLDLIPGWIASLKPDAEQTAAASTSTADEDAAPVPAFADGGPLLVAEDAPKTLTEALIRTATRYPDKGIIYIQSDGSEIRQSFSTLLAEAKTILAGLYQSGLQPGDRAILQLESLRDHFATFWACVLGGITPVTVAIPSTYGDRNAVVNKLYNTWELLEHPPILASERLIDGLVGLQQILPISEPRVLAVEALRRHEPTEQIYQAQPTDLVFFQLTSGSTGVPKCIQETHRGIISHVHGSQQFNGYTPDDVNLNWLPVDHVVPILTCHLKDVYLGCQELQVKSDFILAEPLRWLDLIERYKVTHTWSPNFGFKLVADRLSKARQAQWDLSSMKFFMNAGEQVTVPVIRSFMEQVAPFGVPLHAMQPAFGMAEACTCMTYQNTFSYETGIHRFDKASLSGRLRNAADQTRAIQFVDLGPPVPGVQIRITDNANLVVPEGVIGRFQIKGDVITPGYLNNPNANAEAFVGDGWFNSGDLGFILNGRLTLTGREKEIIIINGANYYCYEIEDVVNELPGVEPTFVGTCAFEDPATGTEGLAVFFTPAVERLEERMELLGTIRTRVASSLGISPAYVVPMPKNEFPKTTSGKIQRTQLKKWLMGGHFQETLKAIDLYQENTNTLPNWFYQPIWRRKEVGAPLRNTADATLVFLDRQDLGPQVCAELRQSQHRCIGVEAGTEFVKRAADDYCIDPAQPQHYQQLAAALAADKIQIDQIIHCWAYAHRAETITTPDALDAMQQLGVISLLHLVQAFGQREPSMQPPRLYVVSSNLQAVSSGEPVAYTHAPLLGLLKTIPQELGWLCSAIDMPGGDARDHVGWLLQELAAGPIDAEVAYRSGQRFVSRLEQITFGEADRGELPFKQQGIYVISGGLGGIGVEICAYLLKQYRARLLLLGRAALPSAADDAAAPDGKSEERIAAYRRLAQLGGEIRYAAVDIGDQEQVQQAVAQATSHWQGDLDGVIHLAGSFEERVLIEETADHLAAMLRAKVRGTWILHQLIKDQPQSLFISFGSVNSFFGGATAGAYAAANAFLDAFSHYQRQSGAIRSVCLAWSMWDELGMSRGYHMKELSRARGYHVITLAEGLHSWLTALHHNQSHLLIGLDDANQHIRRFMELEAVPLSRLTAYFTTRDHRVPSLPGSAPDRFGQPTACHLVEVQSLPRLADGSVDVAALSRAHHARSRRQKAIVAPRTPVEQTLAELWKQVLHIDRVSIDDNFFALGGHSIMATQMVSRIRDVFQVEVVLRTLFESPTIAGLAAQIEAARQSALGRAVLPLQPIARDQALPLSFAQQRLWFLDQLQPGSIAYNIPAAVRLTGPLDVDRLAACFTEILRRHEVLRTTFAVHDGQPVQQIHPPQPVAMPLHDLAAQPETTRAAVAEQTALALIRQPFNLQQGPVFRAQVLRLTPTEHLLVVVLHHIVADGWSMGVLIHELATLYRAAPAEWTSVLPALPIQYADYAVWQRQWLAPEAPGAALEQQWVYWQQQLRGPLPTLALPTDQPRPAVQSERGARQQLQVNAALTASLKALSRQADVTLFMTLLAAFQTLLWHASGQEDIIVGTDVAGRSRAETEGLIGFFVNQLVLRTDLSGDPSFRALLGRVREVALGAYAHQDLPFDHLVAKLHPERQANRTPLFQVKMILQNTPLPTIDLADLKLSPLAVETVATPFDLVLGLQESDHGIDGMLDYNTDLFEKSSMSRLIRQFSMLLQKVVAQPDAPLSMLAAEMTAHEQEQQRIAEADFANARRQKLGTIKRKTITDK